MIITIAVLVSVVISLGISMYFYKVNKENSQNGQIKKFGDKMIGEINEVYNNIVKQYNMLISDFKAQQSQANAAIRVFSTQNEEFNQKINTLSESIKSVQFIEEKLNGYATVLNDLNEMTEQVEENLNRIKKENSIITKATDEINKQKQTIDVITKKIPQISEDFSKHNEEQLKSIATNLLESYKQYAIKLETDIKASQQSADSLLLSIKQNIASAYSDAAAKAQSLEDMAFKHLSEQSKIKAEEYKKEVKIILHPCINK